MANKSLTDLTARTATADSDLLHINSGGTDYKETKADFLRGAIHTTFSTSSTLTSQIDALPVGTYVGTISSNGHQTETGVPKNSSFYVNCYKYSASSAICYITSFTGISELYFKKMYGGTWDTDWTLVPTRSEITSLNNSLTQLIKTGVASVSDPITNASAGATGHFTVTVSTPSGYTLLGVIGYEGSGTGGFSYSDIYVTSNTSIEVYYRNNNTVAKSVTLWKAYVLYVKTL